MFYTFSGGNNYEEFKIVFECGCECVFTRERTCGYGTTTVTVSLSILKPCPKHSHLVKTTREIEELILQQLEDDGYNAFSMYGTTYIQNNLDEYINPKEANV